MSTIQTSTTEPQERVLSGVVPVQLKGTRATAERYEFRPFTIVPRVPETVHFTILVVGDSRAGKTKLRRQLHRHFQATVPVYGGKTIRIEVSHFSVFIGGTEFVIRVVDTPGLQDSEHTDEIVRAIEQFLILQARQHEAIPHHQRRRNSQLVNVVLLASGAHSENNALVTLAKITSRFAPTIPVFLKVDAYTPEELAHCKRLFSEKVQQAGVQLLIPDGVDVGYNLIGTSRENIGGRPVDPLADDCDPRIQNRALWDFLNQNSGMLIQESQARSSLALKRSFLRRVADGAQYWATHTGMAILVAVLGIIVFSVISFIAASMPSRAGFFWTAN